jgi:hypothetical protein
LLNLHYSPLELLQQFLSFLPIQHLWYHQELFLLPHLSRVPFTTLLRILQDWELLRELQRVKLGQGKIKRFGCIVGN